jgi:hypothetical protein
MKIHLFWLAVSIAALILGTRFSQKELRVIEKPIQVIKEVPKEIEKIVEKKVEVPAEIPDVYLRTKQFAESYIKAAWVDGDDILKGVPSVRVLITLSDPKKSKISESELKDSIELSLRKNGIPVKGDSGYFLTFDVSGLWDDKDVRYSYSAALSLSEGVRILRAGEFKISSLVVWRQSYTGYVGSQKVSEGISGVAEKLVISFSNAYLAANPK